MSEWVSVEKSEFDEFIKNYPRELKTHAVTVCDPPVVEYWDHELGKGIEVGTEGYSEACVVALAQGPDWLNNDSFDYKVRKDKRNDRTVST
jgi:hypothetical protein